MGVPVITLAGSGMTGRLSSSILKSADCTEWIARSKEEYTSIAEALYEKGIQTNKERYDLRKKIRGSNLSNGKIVSTELERLYKRELYISENARSM